MFIYERAKQEEGWGVMMVRKLEQKGNSKTGRTWLALDFMFFVDIIPAFLSLSTVLITLAILTALMTLTASNGFATPPLVIVPDTNIWLSFSDLSTQISKPMPPPPVSENIPSLSYASEEPVVFADLQRLMKILQREDYFLNEVLETMDSFGHLREVNVLDGLDRSTMQMTGFLDADREHGTGSYSSIGAVEAEWNPEMPSAIGMNWRLAQAAQRWQVRDLTDPIIKAIRHDRMDFLKRSPIGIPAFASTSKLTTIKPLWDYSAAIFPEIPVFHYNPKSLIPPVSLDTGINGFSFTSNGRFALFDSHSIKYANSSLEAFRGAWWRTNPRYDRLDLVELLRRLTNDQYLSSSLEQKKKGYIFFSAFSCVLPKDSRCHRPVYIYQAGRVNLKSGLFNSTIRALLWVRVMELRWKSLSQDNPGDLDSIRYRIFFQI